MVATASAGALSLVMVVLFPSAPSGASQGSSTAHQSLTTSYTGIDPGKGSFYTYAPSTVQTNSTTRYVFYCQNSPSNTVKDHVFLSVGHLHKGRWQYNKPTVALAPKAGTYYSVHTCEPQVVGGKFRFGGHQERWAMFFTAESAATNSTNQIGLAFANSLSGPWTVDPQPLVKTSDDFGKNSYPNDCPVYSNGRTFYCLGEPTATTVSGRLVLAYMGNSGSPGSISNPVEGVVFRELDLSNVPSSGPCPKCFLTLPNGQKEAGVSTAGLGQWWFHDPSIAYDAFDHRMVVSYDSGPPDSSPDGPPVTPVVTVATMPIKDFLRGKGTWTVQSNFGRCLSGYTDNHNTGIVQTANGDTPQGNSITDIYTVADDNLNNDWGVWDYRLWSVDVPLAGSSRKVPSVTAASASCPGLSVASSTGHVGVGGSAKEFGSAKPNRGSSVAGMALTPDRQGYYLVTKTGQVLTSGDARAQGSLPSHLGAKDVVGMALDSATGGYWIARANGSVYGFGAPELGNAVPTSGSGPVVAIASLPSGQGYYLATANGAVTAYGSATAYGNFSVPPGQSVAAMATTPNGRGYYLVTSSGTLGALGDATVFGSSTVPATSPVVGIAVSLDGFGYWTLEANGQITAAGDAASPAVSVDPPPGGAVAIVSS